MKKNLILLLVAGFALAGCSMGKDKVEYNTDGYQMKELDPETVTVTFYKTIGK